MKEKTPENKVAKYTVYWGVQNGKGVVFYNAFTEEEANEALEYLHNCLGCTSAFYVKK